MKNRLRSITLRLTGVTIGVFALMLLFSNYMLGEAQMRMAQKLTSQLETSLYSMEEDPDSDQQLMLIIDETQIRTMADYRLYAGGILLLTMAIGGCLFIIVIQRMLRPLRILTEKVNQIDINNVEFVKDEIVIQKGSYELRALSEGFQAALHKIYENYQKQLQFSSNVAHELRTPLAVLRTKIDVFKKKNPCLLPEMAGFVETMERNIARLSNLVEEILFLTRDAKPNIKKVSVRGLAEEVLLDLEEKALSHQITLLVQGDAKPFATDDILLERAIYNLVDNGIKYNVPGGSCSVVIQEKKQKLIIEVMDTGIGMGPEEKQHAFDLFYRADASRSHKTAGYGIGLALVRDIVQRLKGNITIWDNTPQGSIFRITFPLPHQTK